MSTLSDYEKVCALIREREALLSQMEERWLTQNKQKSEKRLIVGELAVLSERLAERVKGGGVCKPMQIPHTLKEAVSAALFQRLCYDVMRLMKKNVTITLYTEQGAPRRVSRTVFEKKLLHTIFQANKIDLCKFAINRGGDEKYQSEQPNTNGE